MKITETDKLYISSAVNLLELHKIYEKGGITAATKYAMKTSKLTQEITRLIIQSLARRYRWKRAISCKDLWQAKNPTLVRIRNGLLDISQHSTMALTKNAINSILIPRLPINGTRMIDVITASITIDEAKLAVLNGGAKKIAAIVKTKTGITVTTHTVANYFCEHGILIRDIKARNKAKKIM